MTTGRFQLGVAALFAAIACGLPSAEAWQARAPQPRTRPGVKKAAPNPTSAKILARVDGQPITQKDLERMLKSRGIAPSAEAAMTPRLIDELIDARLLRRYLAERKIDATREEIEEQIALVERFLESDGKSKRTLADLGYTEQTLREDVALPIAWKNYIARNVTEAEVSSYFDEHRQEFDGTEVRVSQILLKVPELGDNPEVDAAREKLQQLRSDILAKKTSFEAAARAHSAAPSREQGGDVGFFPWQGVMPEAFSRAAFDLQPGEISQPFTTPFGVHLCILTERKPGDLSLEDARASVLARISQELRQKKLQELRARAKIERTPAS